MLYCIYHGYPLNGRGFDIGVDKSFVDKIVEAYLKGENNIYISGKNYSIGSETLQIYEASQFVKREDLQKMLDEVHHYNLSEALFEKIFRNVTNNFLKDRNWGDLKENYFNIYINDGDNKPIIILLAKHEVLKFISEFSQGKKSIWISGRNIKLNDPKTIKIFDIDFKYLSKNRGDIKKRLEDVALFNGGWNMKTLEEIGKEVTENFEIQMASKDEITNMNYNIGDKKIKIFISHSSLDKITVDNFVQKILRLGLEISMEQIFCTSIEGMGISTGDDFRNRIKEELTNSGVVMIILSESYKKSEICLNEMGASWVLNKKVIPIIISPLEYDKVGALHITNHIDKIETTAGLDNTIQTIKSLLGLPDFNIANLNRHRDDFLKAVNK